MSGKAGIIEPVVHDSFQAAGGQGIELQAARLHGWVHPDEFGGDRNTEIILQRQLQAQDFGVGQSRGRAKSEAAARYVQDYDAVVGFHVDVGEFLQARSRIGATLRPGVACGFGGVHK